MQESEVIPIKIQYSKSFCYLQFEENDKFAGKMLEIEGELVENGFYFKEHPLCWLTPYKTGYMQKPVEENEKDELITYIISEAKKQGDNLGLIITKNI